VQPSGLMLAISHTDISPQSKPMLALASITYIHIHSYIYI